MFVFDTKRSHRHKHFRIYLCFTTIFIGINKSINYLEDIFTKSNPKRERPTSKSLKMLPIYATFAIFFPCICETLKTPKLSKNIQSILKPLHKSHIYFSLDSFGELERSFFSCFHPQSTFVIIAPEFQTHSEIEWKPIMLTKFESLFLHVSFMDTQDRDFNRSIIVSPRNLDRIFLGYRDPLAVLLISSEQFDFSILRPVHVKPTILAVNPKSIHLICPICEKLDWKLSDLEELDTTWRHIYLANGGLIHLHEFKYQPDLHMCNLLTNR